jgi:hypothetical protein
MAKTSQFATGQHRPTAHGPLGLCNTLLRGDINKPLSGATIF